MYTRRMVTCLMVLGCSPERMRRALCALLSALGLEAAGAAETVQATVPPGAPAATSLQLPDLRVEGHYENDVGTSDAASEGVIQGAIAKDIPLLRPGEILETVPGLLVTQHSGDGKANQYFLRGYNLDHGTDLSVSIDGVGVNLPTNAHAQGYADLNFLIPEVVDRIDYRKGPYYAEDGDFAAAGAVKIHYRNTLDRNFANLTAGSFGYERALLAGSCKIGGAGNCISGGAGEGPALLA